MPGWEVSRHPEWELMYAAGMAVQEISDWVGHPRSTVHRHLQVRELYIPGLRATHEAAYAARQPGWPNHHWRNRIKELQAFLTEHGHGPERHASTHAEVSLHFWLRLQRQEHRKGILHPAKVNALRDLWPEWAEPAEIDP